MSDWAASVVRMLCTRPCVSVPSWTFIPKYQVLPFFVWRISGSRVPRRFFVELGAEMMVASTIVPCFRSAEIAKARADRLAGEFANQEALPAVPTPVQSTVDRLIDRYVKEVTPNEGTSKQGHDRHAARIFKALFGRKLAANLDLSDWIRSSICAETAAAAASAPSVRGRSPTTFSS
jgi:hypothetical protein